MTAAAVLVLRRKQPNLVRPYRTLGYPVIPLLFVAGAIILLITTFIERPRESLMGLGLMALGIPFYHYWRRKNQHE